MSVTNMSEETAQLSSMVSRRVRGLLAELGMNQQDLAPILGVSGSATSKRIRGLMAFPIDELPVLAEALDTSVAYLLGLTDVRRAPSTGVDRALDVSVRHEGLEPPTRWFAALAPVERLADVLPFRARLPHGPQSPAQRPVDPPVPAAAPARSTTVVGATVVDLDIFRAEYLAS